MWWALIGGLLLTSGLALSSESHKRRALADYQRAVQERDQLSQELTGIRQSMTEQAGQMGALTAQLAKAEQELTRLNAEYARLQDSNDRLTTQLADVTQAKAALEAKLSSIRSLKLAMRQLRDQQWRSFWADLRERWIAHAEAVREQDQQRSSGGNHGMLVRNGIPTIGSRTTLQVRVLDPQTE